MLLNYLFDENPYRDFPVQDFQLDIAGFCLPKRLLGHVVNYSHIIEVGTWKGCSAFLMANLLKETGRSFEIICVDTWLGAVEMWDKDIRDGWARYSGLALRHGYPTIYYQFLANVIKLGYQDSIVPFPNTSQIAARLLGKIGYKADFIYIDGSHDYEDVIADLDMFWDLLNPGGIMGGDDVDIVGVDKAVTEFAHKNEIIPTIYTEEVSWHFKK